MVHNSSDAVHDSMGDRRILSDDPRIKVLGSVVDKRRSISATVSAREQAAMGVWFKHHRSLCCRRTDRLQRLHATARAAFMFGAGGCTLPT